MSTPDIIPTSKDSDVVRVTVHCLGKNPFPFRAMCKSDGKIIGAKGSSPEKAARLCAAKFFECRRDELTFMDCASLPINGCLLYFYGRPKRGE